MIPHYYFSLLLLLFLIILVPSHHLAVLIYLLFIISFSFSSLKYHLCGSVWSNHIEAFIFTFFTLVLLTTHNLRCLIILLRSRYIILKFYIISLVGIVLIFYFIILSFSIPPSYWLYIRFFFLFPFDFILNQ